MTFSVFLDETLVQLECLTVVFTERLHKMSIKTHDNLSCYCSPTLVHVENAHALIGVVAAFLLIYLVYDSFYDELNTTRSVIGRCL